MTDRLDEIRTRLIAGARRSSFYVTDSSDKDYPIALIRCDGLRKEMMTLIAGHERMYADFIAHAPADIAYLLAEVERLRNTNLSAGNGLCDGDEPVAQDVTKQERP